MLDILEFAKEKGMEEGLQQGLQQGLDVSQNMVMDALLDRFNVAAAAISDKIRSIRNLDALRVLLRQAIKCKDLGEFEAVLRQMTS